MLPGRAPAMPPQSRLDGNASHRLQLMGYDIWIFPAPWVNLHLWERDQPGSQVEAACLGIRSSVGCALIIHLIIQTILLDPSGAVWTDGASNVSSLDPSGAIQADAEHPSRNRK